MKALRHKRMKVEVCYHKKYMPMISREVRSLVINVITTITHEKIRSKREIMVEVEVKVPSTSEASGTDESFKLNPCARNINPSSVERVKLCLKETEEFPEDQKIKVSIENGLKVRDALEKNRSEFSWSSLLSRT